MIDRPEDDARDASSDPGDSRERPRHSLDVRANACEPQRQSATTAGTFARQRVALLSYFTYHRRRKKDFLTPPGSPGRAPAYFLRRETSALAFAAGLALALAFGFGAAGAFGFAAFFAFGLGVPTTVMVVGEIS